MKIRFSKLHVSFWTQIIKGSIVCLNYWFMGLKKFVFYIWCSGDGKEYWSAMKPVDLKKIGMSKSILILMNYWYLWR